MSRTRTILFWGNFCITGHILVFKIQKCFHDKFRKSVMCMTMVGVDAVQTLPHGPDQPTESVRGGGDACHSCCRMWKMWLRSIAERWLACTHHPRCPRDARLDWNQVSEHAGQSMQVTCCCCYCKNLLKTQALCRQVLSYWRIASCPMACKE